MTFTATLKYTLFITERHVLRCAFTVPEMYRRQAEGLEAFRERWLRVRFEGALQSVDWIPCALLEFDDAPDFVLIVPVKTPEGMRGPRQLLRQSVRVEVELMQNGLFEEPAETWAGFVNRRAARRLS